MSFLEKILGKAPDKIIQKDKITQNNDINHNIAEVLFGNSSNGHDFDQIPDGIGEFGYSIDNPIPTNGVVGSKKYLNCLKTNNGQNTKSQRIGTFRSEKVEGIIDGYTIFDNNGHNIATLYICPYYGKLSSKSPKNFILNTNE